MSHSRSLNARLAAAAVKLGTAPVDAWRRLREIEGPRTTVIDLYELVARQRGLAAHELPLKERITLARSVMPEVWPGFATTEGSERRGDVIRIVDYDPEWPRRFQRWHRILRSYLGETDRRIEHVGSTSVPGLAAKPIIDIQVSVADLDDESRYMPPLEQAGCATAEPRPSAPLLPSISRAATRRARARLRRRLGMGARPSPVP